MVSFKSRLAPGSFRLFYGIDKEAINILRVVSKKDAAKISQK